MGCWGMGITQSDEYCEMYERFMEEYDEGKPLSSIKQDILYDYLMEFDENDGVLHDVYFAIGKAEWMCGGISSDIYEIISNIIRNDENISFYRELEASESDLKLRKKNLDKFLLKLSTPRGKIKKRRVPTEKYVEVKKPKLPSFRCGDIFAYEVDGKYRLLCCITREKFYLTYASYCYAWAKLYEQIPSVEELENDYIVPLGYFTAENFPDMDKLSFVGNSADMLKLDLTYPHVLFKPWKPAKNALAKERHLSERYALEMCKKCSDCLKRIEELRRNAGIE